MPVAIGTDLGNGSAFCLNGGEGNFILRDDARPAFVDSDELLFTNVPAKRWQDRSTVELPVAFLKAFGTLKNKSSEEVNKVVTREARPNDYDSLREMAEKWFRDPNTHEVLSKEVDGIMEAIRNSLDGYSEDNYIVAEDVLGQTLGLMGLQNLDQRLWSYSEEPERSKEIIVAFLAPNQRRKGTGRILVEVLEGIARQQNSEDVLVVSGPIFSETGWGFWTCLYGDPIDEIPGYFGPGINAMVWRNMIIRSYLT